MKFKGTELPHITFSTSTVRGYKKQDVDDFLFHISKDYKNFELRIQELKEDMKVLEEEKAAIEEYVEVLKEEQQRAQKKQQKELQKLRKELSEAYPLMEKDGEYSKKQALNISQKIGFSLRKEAEKEAREIREQADMYCSIQVANVQDVKKQLLEEVAEEKNKLEELQGKIVRELSETSGSVNKIFNQLEERYEQLLLLNNE